MTTISAEDRAPTKGTQPAAPFSTEAASATDTAANNSTNVEVNDPLAGHRAEGSNKQVPDGTMPKQLPDGKGGDQPVLAPGSGGAPSQSAI